MKSKDYQYSPKNRQKPNCNIGNWRYENTIKLKTFDTRDGCALMENSDRDTPDIELSKTMRVQLNIAENSLADFLIKSGDTQWNPKTANILKKDVDSLV